MKIQRSKNRLSKELIKVLEKVEIDRPAKFKAKASILLQDEDSHNLMEYSPENKERLNNVSLITRG